MTRLLILIALLTAGLGLGFQDRPEAQARGLRFQAIDIFIDSAESSLAAYQVEIKAEPNPAAPGTSKVSLVGITGGDHAAFKNPPHYDPAALHENQLKDRIILAAFNTGSDLPKGKTRIAQIQIQLEGPDPVYTVHVMAAGAPDGTKFTATATAAAAGDTR